MIFCPRVDLAGPVNLFQEHHSGQVVGEGHGGHGQLFGGLGLDGRVEPAGAADEESQAALSLVGPSGHEPGQLLAGAFPPLYAQGLPNQRGDKIS